MWPIVGHEAAVDMLQRSIAEGRVAHAYLFVGPAHVGKTTLARTFAQALNCTGTGERPCGGCMSCRKLAFGSHPDIRVIESEGDSLKIDQIRALQNDVSLSAYESTWKVYILCDFEQATIEAANCLLKTLEEPPAHVVLLLTALSPAKLLSTIVSRCQIISLRPLALEPIRMALIERWQVEPEQAELLARLSTGRIGWAVTALGDRKVMERRAETLQAIGRLCGSDRVERMRYADMLSNAKDALGPIFEVWESWWRDLLLVKVGADQALVNVDCINELKTQAARYTQSQITTFLDALMSAEKRLEAGVNPRLALEVLFLNLPGLET